MKKSLVLAGLVAVSAIAIAPSAVRADFQGPTNSLGAETMSVDKVLGLKLDRDHVCMTGRIVSKLATDHDKYVFKDMTGEIVVEIDQKTFRGQTVTPESRVRVCGEVDAEVLKPNEFDADVLDVLQ
ncbi:MAG: NirD/YgiW/YdeI family stress tolerance protein [Desulfovibrionaceae bacterium]|nr:NirD/YgiW/YdeI family stress tolerance protein [Desulfovibrionaceae bacterium]